MTVCDFHVIRLQTAVKGIAMTFVEEKLRASAEYFAILEREGNLVATSLAE